MAAPGDDAAREVGERAVPRRLGEGRVDARRRLAPVDVLGPRQADRGALRDGGVAVADALGRVRRGADEDIRAARVVPSAATTPAGSGGAGVAPSAPVDVAGVLAVGAD